jgi:hypothetical protein
MIMPLIMVIRLAITWGVIALPLKRESRPEIEIIARAARSRGGYLNGRKSG